MVLSACGGGSHDPAAADAAPGDGGTGSDNADTGGAGGTGTDPNPAPAEPPPEAQPPAGFVHPGLLHTEADFRRMAAKVAAGAAPWTGSWNRLIANSHASLSYTARPQVELSRGNDGVHPDNSARLFNDVAAAYQCAVRWKVSGDTAYADKAVQIMNAWSSTLTAIYGTTGLNGDNDGILMAGFQGYQFANAGEIMRTYPGWAAADFAAFQQMMAGIFYPVNHAFMTRTGTDLILSYANWELCSIASIMAIGVLCDDKAKFDEAISYFTSGLGNGALAQAVYYMHPGYLGQMQESGRDQGHNTLCVSTITTICEMAWNQGVDLYGLSNNAVLAGAEYVAKGNLLTSSGTYGTVPYTTYRNHNVTQTTFSTTGQGSQRPSWALVYNHYVNRRGLAAPYCAAFAQQMAPEGGGGDYGPNSGGYDQLGFGTLTHWLDPIAQGVPASGLTARLVSGSVELSWWGSAYASSYTVRRSASPGGPYATVASGISDLLTFTDTPPAPGRYTYVVHAVTGGTVGSPSNEASVLVGKNLVMRLAFDEGSGTLAGDSSGNGRSGRLVGGATWAAGPRAGMGAVSLDGSSGCIELPADLTTELGDCTIAVWVYWRLAVTDACVFWLGRNVDQYWRLTPRDVNGVMRFAGALNGVDGEQQMQAPSVLARNAWVHLGVTLSGTTATLYLDGAPVASSDAMAVAPHRLGPTPLNSLGRRYDGRSPYLNGTLADFRLYSGALSAAEIASVYAGG